MRDTATLIALIRAYGKTVSDSSDGSESEVPIASLDIAGVVKSSSTENGVSVNPDGTMEVNGITLDRVVQPDGDVLILSSGDSTI